MKGIMNKLLALADRLKQLTMQYFFILIAWKMKLLKTQMKKMKRSKAAKHMEKAYSGLGAEIYALYKDGETSWNDAPAVENNLAKVEQEEAKIFEYDEIIDRITDEYLAKKERIKAKYSAEQAEPEADDAGTD